MFFRTPEFQVAEGVPPPTSSSVIALMITDLTLMHVATSLVLTTCSRRGSFLSLNRQTPHRRSDRTAMQPANKQANMLKCLHRLEKTMNHIKFLMMFKIFLVLLHSLNSDVELICLMGPLSWWLNGSLLVASRKEEFPSWCCSATLWKSEVLC